jgi:signal transduction histidine kinase
MNDKTDLLIAIGASTIVMALLTVFVIYFVIIYRKEQRAFEWERDAFKHALLQTEIEIKEETLSNISRELHDNFGQMASLIKINLNMALAETPEVQTEKITESLTVVKQLIADIKSLSVSLKGENLARFGLIEMIKKDLDRYRKIGNWNIHFDTSENLPTFEGTTEIFLYRMSQEIMSNCIKHANATEVSVNITSDNAIFELEISDNGIGFDTENKNQGSGLINLKDRSEMIGAKLLVDSKIGLGTTIKIQKKINSV